MDASREDGELVQGDDTDHLEEGNGGGPAISNLPDELLAMIISMVPISQWARLESVSRPFRDAVYLLWNRPKLDIRLDELVYNQEKKQAEPYETAEAVLTKFHIRAPTAASIGGFEEFFDQNTPIRLETIQLLSRFKHLQTIDFSSQRMISVGYFAVFLDSSESRQCWNYLNIDGGIYGSIRIHDGQPNRSALMNLKCFEFNAEYLHIFGRFLPIDWSGLAKLIIVDSGHFETEVLSVIRQCTRLDHLEIDVPEWNENWKENANTNPETQPSYANFMQAVASMENLSVLKIYAGSWFGEPFQNALLALIEDLGRRRRHITDFALKDSPPKEYPCTDQILDAIVDHMPRLKSLELHVTNCSQASLERLANMMGQLESLKLQTNESNLNGNVIRAIGANMKGLQCLHLKNPNVRSEDLKSLGDLGKLKDLRIMGRLMDGGTIETWTRGGLGKCMEVLKLSLQGDISPNAMGDFLNKMPRLRCLRLDEGVTNGTLKAVAASCPNLIELQLWHPSSITRTGIQSIIDKCTLLKMLQIYRIDGFEWFPAALTVGKYRKITFES